MTIKPSTCLGLAACLCGEPCACSSHSGSLTYSVPHENIGANTDSDANVCLQATVRLASRYPVNILPEMLQYETNMSGQLIKRWVDVAVPGESTINNSQSTSYPSGKRSAFFSWPGASTWIMHMESTNDLA